MKNTLFVLACLFSLGLYAQNESIVKGNIIDLEANNEPLMFADIILAGTDYKTQTNFNGNFELVDVAAGNYTLEISFLGYETLSLPVEVGENKVIDIQKGLLAKSISLDPVVLASLETISDENVLADLERSIQD